MASTKLLIAIPTAHKYEGNDISPNRNEGERRRACRETWLRSIPDPEKIDYRFFYGAPRPPKLECDEVAVDCFEGYGNLPRKFQLMCQWALDRDYTHLFRVDTDAYVYVDRLLRSGFERHDYTGYTIDYPKHLEWAKYASGAGWVLSRRAMEIVCNGSPDDPADDLWTGRVLYQNGINCHRETRYLCGFEQHFVPVQQLHQLHPYIVVHALRPHEIRLLHERGNPGSDMTAPDRPFREPDHKFNYGNKHPECECSYCKSLVV